LTNCSDLFIPPLTVDLNIDSYSQKIIDKADTFEAWNRDRLIGLVAAYCNNVESKEAFITNVSILKAFNNMGIASELLSICIQYVESIKFRDIRLKVRRNNTIARKLYTKHNFQQIGFEDGFVIMRRESRNE